jgi:hypothetical protein
MREKKKGGGGGFFLGDWIAMLGERRLTDFLVGVGKPQHIFEW